MAITVPLQKFTVFAHVVRTDGPQELDVVVTVELRHLVLHKLQVSEVSNCTYRNQRDGCYLDQKDQNTMIFGPKTGPSKRHLFIL